MRLSGVQVARAALTQWGREDAVTAVAIARPESGWDSDASGDPVSAYPGWPASSRGNACNGVRSGETDLRYAHGLWQIMLGGNSERMVRDRRNWITGLSGTSDSCGWRDWLYVPNNNAWAAHDLWLGGGWGHWTAYNNRSYRAWLAAAEAAINEVLGEPIDGDGDRDGDVIAGPYMVQAGDTLSSISLRAYGTALLWPGIYCYNKQGIGCNPNLIFPGQILGIPFEAEAKAVTQYYVVHRSGQPCASDACPTEEPPPIEPIAPVITALLFDPPSPKTAEIVTVRAVYEGDITLIDWRAPGGTPASSGEGIFETSFATTGTKTISLTLCNGSACSTASVTVTVVRREPPPTEPVAPVINFLSVTPLDPQINETVSFGPGIMGTVTSYAWSAPGGSPSSGKKKTFSTKYAKKGSKRITLEACNGAACSSASLSIEVAGEPPPEPDPDPPDFPSADPRESGSPAEFALLYDVGKQRVDIAHHARTLYNTRRQWEDLELA